MSDDDPTFISPPLPILSNTQQADYDSMLIDLNLKQAPVQSEVSQPPNKKSRANSSRYSSTRSAWDRTFSAAKFARRAVNPHMQLVETMMRGAITRWGAVRQEDEDSDTLPANEVKLREQQVKEFDIIIKNMRDMAPVLKYMYLDSATCTAWEILIKKLHHDCVQTRANDTSKLKTKHEYFLPDDRKDVLFPALRNNTVKTDRDLGHPMLRHLLLPPHMRMHLPPLEFRQPAPDTPTPTLSAEAQKIIDGIAANTLVLTVDDFPSAFWEEGSYDPEDEAQGLFKGYMMARFMRHIWTGPESAMVDPSKKRKQGLRKDCNANLHRQYVVTPEMAGNVACQVRTALSNDNWSETDGDFDYEELFKSVVAILTPDPATPAGVRAWAKETLQWLQDQTFGSYTPENDDEEESRPAVSRVVARIFKQRASCTLHLNCSVIYATFARRRSQTLFALLLTSGAICSPIHPAIQVVDDSQLGNNHSCRWYASIPVRVTALLLTAHTVLTCLATHSFIEISHTTIMIQVSGTSHFLICPVTHSLIETPAIPATHEL
ncbi:hypothetical protein GGX14DRAFT_578994 [Mycena pura]|uniref:Uncharacterized protein n=1 Tax=Mycena pura TaxID=153505 RepID=A0AAD6XZ04_9AGAR|nr:hypothetical protein GGX14DRAFT_578994 [Mycena pura]